MKHILMIELDVLLDTRLGVINQYNEEVAIEVLTNGWMTRQSNVISQFTDKITDEEYEELWNTRNASVLPYSRMSNFIVELNDQVEQLKEQIIMDSGRIKEAGIVINTYPYTELTEEELVGIIEAVSERIGKVIPIRVSCYSPRELDLPFFKHRGILTYIVNDWTLWMNEAMAVDKGQDALVCNPKLNIIAPKLLNKMSDIENITQSDKETMGNLDVFGVLQVYWAPVFGIQFCPVELMSLIDLNVLPD